MKHETGTARELDLQVGDVVRHTRSLLDYEIVDTYAGLIFKSVNGGWLGKTVDESQQIYEVISRASTPETGTLAELGVKPGDVVEFVEGTHDPDVKACFKDYKNEYGGYQYVININGNADSDEDGAGGGWLATCTHIFRIVSRAKQLEDIAHKSPSCGWQDATHATPQRYVVLTDDDTIICTRSEAEDLAARGVDAVYKLGDKVNVTVTLDLEGE